MARGQVVPFSSLESRKLAALAAELSHALEIKNERLQLLEAVVENFPGGVALFDSTMQMTLCNQRLRDMLEYPEALFAQRYPTLEELFHFNAKRGEYGPGDQHEQVARRLALLRERRAHVYERTRPNGIVIEVRGVPLDGGGFVTTYFDVTEQRRTQALIAHMAHHDGLTDLPNRLLLIDRLQTAIALAKRRGLVAVHYLDLDGFKKVNDTLGHKAGDELLVGIAQRLRISVRENDTVARLGGDEFAIVQTGIESMADATVLAARVVDLCARPFGLGDHTATIGVSVGIALAPLHGTTTDEVLVKADTALYRSKAGGRGRYTFFGEGGQGHGTPSA